MPIAQADAARTLVGVPIGITVLSNDSGGALTVVGYSQPVAGTVALNADQSFTYTPADGFEGSDGFAYTVRDPVGGTASAEVTITVTRANAAPIAAGDTAQLLAGDSVAVAVLANDNDPDGDAFGIIGIDAPGHGTIQVEPDQKIRYTAEPGFSGIDSFSYTIGDGRGGAGSASVTVTVIARNTPPIAAADLVSTASGVPVTIDALANDNDPDGDEVSLAGMSLPIHGSLTLTPDQSFVYAPAPDFVGTDGFSYTIMDEGGATAIGEVSVAVERRNMPPVATPDSATSSGQPVTLDLLANDSDPDGDPLRLAALTVPIQGHIAVNTDGRVTYTPPAGFVGNDTFTYQVSDGITATEAGVVVTVTGATPPTYANGYSFRRRLLIPADSVSGSGPITDYIMLVDEALGAGKVTSAQGNDIRFETVAGGKLDHELDTFTSATGRLVAWVRIPSLPANAATQIMLYYGKTGAVAEANAVGVWRNYLAVWNARTGADRTGQGRTLTPTAVGSGTLLGGAGSYNGTSSKAAIATQPWANGLSALTVEAVVKAAAAGVSRGILSAGPASATADTALGLALSYQNPGRVAGSASTIAFKLGTTGGAAYVEAAASSQSSAAQCLAGVWASGQLPRLYIDGAQTIPSNSPAAITGTTQIDIAGWLSIGWSPVTGFWSGAIDEVRIRASAVPEATLRTQALNYLTPTLFYGIGAEDMATTANQSPVAGPIQISVTAGTVTDVDVAKIGVEPDGQPLTASVPSQPDRGTTVIVANKVRYTAPATGGVIGTAPFALSDGLKSSSSVIRAKVSSVAVAWWRAFPRPAGRANGRRSGGSYYFTSASAFSENRGKYEREVGIMEGANGAFRNNYFGLDSTELNMRRLTGGPYDTVNDTIISDGALNWTVNNSNWTTGWNKMPKNSVLCYTANLQPDDRPTESGDFSFYDEVIAGTWDLAYRNMGRRLVRNLTEPARNPQGHTADYLMYRLNHENNQSNLFRVFPASKLRYKAAMERAIDMIREGMGTTYGNMIKFMHAPAHDSEGQDLGSYMSWCPDNVDVLSVSYHPNKKQKSRADLVKYHEGTDPGFTYGLYEIMEAAVATNRPVCFPEWSPRYEMATGCPVADLVYEIFDEFLTENKDQIVCDMVFNPNHLDPNAWQDKTGDPAGWAAWIRGVARYKALWSGIKVP